MKPINPHYLMARRRAERNEAMFGHSYLNYPAIARKGKPIPQDLETPAEPERDLSEIPGWNWDTALLVVCVVVMIGLLFIEVPHGN